jgi:hypothetical protein
LAEHPTTGVRMWVSHPPAPFSPVRTLLKQCCAISCGPSGTKWPQNMIPAAILLLKDGWRRTELSRLLRTLCGDESKLVPPCSTLLFSSCSYVQMLEHVAALDR